METGVNGFVLKNRSLSGVIAEIRQAAEGEMVISASLLKELLGRTTRASAEHAAPADRDSLTPRELEIVTCLARGMSGPDIAAQLNIAPLTVRTHLRNIMEKLGVHSRLEAVSYALRQGLIEPPA